MYTESFEQPQFLTRHEDIHIDNSQLQGDEHAKKYQDDHIIQGVTTIDVISEEICTDLCEISKLGTLVNL